MYSEDLDKPVHPHSLTRVFTVRKYVILIYSEFSDLKILWQKLPAADVSNGWEIINYTYGISLANKSYNGYENRSIKVLK